MTKDTLGFSAGMNAIIHTTESYVSRNVIVLKSYAALRTVVLQVNIPSINSMYTGKIKARNISLVGFP